MGLRQCLAQRWFAENEYSMISCKEVTQLVSQGLDRHLSLRERWRLWLHLRACKNCPRFVEQMRFLSNALRRYREGSRDKT